MIRVATAADQGRIADAARQLATRSAGGRGSKDLAISIYGYRTDGALLMPAMKCGGVLVYFALRPRFPLASVTEFFVGAQLDAFS